MTLRAYLLNEIVYVEIKMQRALQREDGKKRG